jgi:hypothetical protein
MAGLVHANLKASNLSSWCARRLAARQGGEMPVTMAKDRIAPVAPRGLEGVEPRWRNVSIKAA